MLLHIHCHPLCMEVQLWIFRASCILQQDLLRGSDWEELVSCCSLCLYNPACPAAALLLCCCLALLLVLFHGTWGVQVTELEDEIAAYSTALDELEAQPPHQLSQVSSKGLLRAALGALLVYRNAADIARACCSTYWEQTFGHGSSKLSVLVAVGLASGSQVGVEGSCCLCH